MSTRQNDLILIVSNDPTINSRIGDQTLKAAGYGVDLVNDVNVALERALSPEPPDLIIADLSLAGLTGKDLLVMLKAQDCPIPAILIGSRGRDSDMLQSFRLGAADYVLWPAREAEVLSAVERVLQQVHFTREREEMKRRIEQTNRELEQRVRELTMIYAIGKTVTSITDETELFEKTLDAAVEATHATAGWLSLRAEGQDLFLLVAEKQAPAWIAAQLHQPIRDEISLLAARSGKYIHLSGDPFSRFRLSGEGRCALVAPLIARDETIGTITVFSKDIAEFSSGSRRLLEAIADYGSISLTNARRFLAAEEKARSLKMLSESQPELPKLDLEMVRSFNREQREALESLLDSMERLGRVPAAQWTMEQINDLSLIQEKLQSLARIARTIQSHAR